MSEQLLTLLKLSLLALLYLFLFRVVRAVWAEISLPSVTSGARRQSRGAPGSGAGTATPAPAGRGARRPKGAKGAVTEAVVVEPAEHRGRAYPVTDEVTVGRAAGCQIHIDDTYASQLHARLFRTEDGLFVEDLGSTNGTVLNGSRVGGPQPVRRGDRLQVGGTTLELR